jgi:hypothetical protein
MNSHVKPSFDSAILCCDGLHGCDLYFHSICRDFIFRIACFLSIYIVRLLTAQFNWLIKSSCLLVHIVFSIAWLRIS